MPSASKNGLPPLKWPRWGACHLLDVRVPYRVAAVTGDPDDEGSLRVDLTIGRDGAIEEMTPLGGLRLRHAVVQGSGRQVWPGFVDIHAHLDKTATWDRAPNHDGSFDGAVQASREARRQPWTEADIFARMTEAAEESFATGTIAIRTHIDSSSARRNLSWPAYERLEKSWRGRLAIQGVVLFGAPLLMEPDAENLANAAARYRAAFGPVIYPSDTLDQELMAAFALAERRGLDLDFHVDETGDAIAHGLDRIADVALSRKFRGRMICGHACSLSLHAHDRAQATIAKLRKAGIGVVSLPATNLYLQGRTPGVTPTWRGITRVHELRAGGVKVAIAGDNRQDAFYPFGDYDMLDVFRDAVRIAHLDMPMTGWIDAVTKTPAELMGLSGVAQIAPGASATFISFPYRTAAEVLARRGRGRQIIRKGRLRM